MIDIAGRHSMWVSDGNVGLIEKNLVATSGLGLSSSVSREGSEWARDADVALTMADAVGLHINNATDPATDSLSLADAATLIMDLPREASSNLTLVDSAHASLDGYHPDSIYDPGIALSANETVVIGQPVYVSGNNTINLAVASDTTKAKTIGLVEVGAVATGTANVVTDGTVEQADWTAVIGTTLLTPGSVYFLSITAGKMSTAPPTGDGEIVVTMGVAVTTTKFDIEINEIVSL